MKLFVILGAILLLSSCQSTGVMNKVKQRYISQQAEIIPNALLDSSQRDTTYCSIVFNHSNNSVSIYDSIYKIEPTWGQAIEMGKHDGSVIIFIVGFIIFGLGLFWCIKKFQDGTRESNDKSVLAWVLIPLVGFGIMGGAFGWDKWNAEREVPKQTYEMKLQFQGNLDDVWQSPAKTY